MDRSRYKLLLFHGLLINPLTPNVMDIVQSSDLREEPSKGLVIGGPVVNRPCPVISPLDHSTGLQAVRAHLINVIAVRARQWLWPVAERQEVLQVPGPEITATIGHQSHVIGIIP